MVPPIVTSPAHQTPPRDVPPRRIRSSDLLRDAREVIIEHAGREYRLRLTAAGKLILTI